jgi:hypothetical protein
MYQSCTPTLRKRKSVLRKKVKKITLEFEDGTTEVVEPWNGWFIEKGNSMKETEFKHIHFTESEVRWSDFEPSSQNGS